MRSESQCGCSCGGMRQCVWMTAVNESKAACYTSTIQASVGGLASGSTHSYKHRRISFLWQTDGIPHTPQNQKSRKIPAKKRNRKTRLAHGPRQIVVSNVEPAKNTQENSRAHVISNRKRSIPEWSIESIAQREPRAAPHRHLATAPSTIVTNCHPCALSHPHSLLHFISLHTHLDRSVQRRSTVHKPKPSRSVRSAHNQANQPRCPFPSRPFFT